MDCYKCEGEINLLGWNTYECKVCGFVGYVNLEEKYRKALEEISEMLASTHEDAVDMRNVAREALGTL